MKSDCIFCKIVAGEIPSEKILEDEEHVAFLGIFPKFSGMTIVIPRKHSGDSYAYQSLSDEQLSKLHLFAKKTALKIDRALGSIRCIQVMEGFDVKEHVHLKLFPVYQGKMYENAYEGSDRATPEELKAVADMIRGVL